MASAMRGEAATAHLDTGLVESHPCVPTLTPCSSPTAFMVIPPS